MNQDCYPNMSLIDFAKECVPGSSGMGFQTSLDEFIEPSDFSLQYQKW